MPCECGQTAQIESNSVNDLMRGTLPPIKMEPDQVPLKNGLPVRFHVNWWEGPYPCEKIDGACVEPTRQRAHVELRSHAAGPSTR